MRAKLRNYAVLFMLAILLLCSCGKKQDYNRTEITFSSWGSKTEVEIMKNVISDFETQNPDIKINFMHIPQNYFQKLHLLFASNTEPDVIFLNNLYLPIYANAGKLTELEPDQFIYNDKILKSLSWNGKYYAIPRDISLLVFYYNKDLFKKAHISTPNKDWTLNDLELIGKKIKEKTGAFGISFDETALFYLPYLMSEGDFNLKNSDEICKKLEFYKDLRHKYNIAPKREQSASATMAQMFLQGKLALILSGRWLTPKFQEEAAFAWDIVTFPKGKKGSIVPLDTSGWAISANSKHKSEAKKFIDYLSSKSTIEKFIQTGLIVPARNDIKLQDAQMYYEALKTAEPTPVTVDYNKTLDKLTQHLEMCIFK